MKQEDLTPEEIAELPDDIQQGLKDGTVLALPVPQPAMSSRFFTVSAAFLVGAMLLPIWIPVTWVSTTGLGLAALCWMYLYWFEGLLHVRTKLALSVTEGVLDRTLQMITQAAEKARNINGTNDGESCLKEENDGTGTVH